MAQAPSTFPRGVHDTQDGVSDGAEALTLPLKPSTFPRALDVPTIMVTPAESFDTLPRPRRHATFGPRASSDLDFHYPTLDRRPRPPILRLPPSDVSSHTSSQSLQPSHPAADLHLIDLISLQKDSPCTTPSTPDVDLSAITDPSILLSLLAKTSIFVPDARAPILHRLADLVLLAKSNPSEARLPDGETYRSTMRVLWSARRMSKFRRSEWDELMERIEAADEEDAGSDATVSDGGGDGDGDGADTEAHAEGEHGHGHGHGRGVGEGEAEDEVRSEAAKSTSTDATRAMHVDLASHDSTGGTYPRTGMATATTTRRGYLSLSSLLGRKK
ncbi:hypothetical protein M427DRAFT_52785 [Gonapodya prolifera JEL478]|uniref:Uncharacterized protein n=1 Tax=Gonapodya prolifera (strain JEL478) TaxID=1344416 RepID=A0A139ATB6_GONPJ|nr:hypothetical protein M427DRAFT_52785 [Gonapodya prolifera JEL478]|eukprot:KXS19966.1 hypothetical protein M427DRAFT_52785 [Gonapodya prolifera JEL478]